MVEPYKIKVVLESYILVSQRARIDRINAHYRSFIVLLGIKRE